jgi:hypothetical protein
MKQMKLYGMHNAFAIERENRPLHRSVCIDAYDAEWDEGTIGVFCSINARFHYKSNIENINFDQTRNLDRNTILRLAE